MDISGSIRLMLDDGDVGDIQIVNGDFGLVRVAYIVGQDFYLDLSAELRDLADRIDAARLLAHDEQQTERDSI